MSKMRAKSGLGMVRVSYGQGRRTQKNPGLMSQAKFCPFWPHFGVRFAKYGVTPGIYW